MPPPPSQRPSAFDAPPDPTTRSAPPPAWGDDLWRPVADEAALLDDAAAPAVDLQRAAETARAVCASVLRDGALHARFLALASAGEFDATTFERLPRYADAAWHAQRMQRLAGPAAREAAVPAAVVARARAVYGRMLPVARDHLAQVAAAAPIVAALDHAPGHRRLAHNLLALAELYDDHRALVARDVRGYRAGDDAEAREAAAAVVMALMAQPVTDAARWGDRCARAWALLSGCYEAVQAAGRFLLRERPDEARRRFPSLVTTARGER